MLLKERAGPVTDQQRRLLEEAEKSCARLSALLGEVSELSQLEAGTATFNRSAVDLQPLLGSHRGACRSCPIATVDVSTRRAEATASPRRCRRACGRADVGHACAAPRARHERPPARSRRRHAATMGAPIPNYASANRNGSTRCCDAAAATSSATFDEWRGGNGLSLPNARRIIEAHGGRLLSPARGRESSAVIAVHPPVSDRHCPHPYRVSSGITALVAHVELARLARGTRVPDRPSSLKIPRLSALAVAACQDG